MVATMMRRTKKPPNKRTNNTASDMATSATGYIRVHGRNYRDWWRESAAPHERYDYLYTAAELEPWAERAKEIGVPTLVVGGGNSPQFMRRAAESVAQALPHARVVLLPDQNHDLSKAGKALTPILTEFFREGKYHPAETEVPIH